MRLARSSPSKGVWAVLALAALASLSVATVVGAGLSVWRGSSAQRAVAVLPDRTPHRVPGAVVTVPTRPAPPRAPVTTHPTKPSVTAPPAPVVALQPKPRHAPRVLRQSSRHTSRPSQPSRPIVATQPSQPPQPTQPTQPSQPVTQPPIPVVGSGGQASEPATTNSRTPGTEGAPLTAQGQKDLDKAAKMQAKAAGRAAKQQAKAAKRLAAEQAKAAKHPADEQAKMPTTPIVAPQPPQPPNKPDQGQQDAQLDGESWSCGVDPESRPTGDLDPLT